VKKKKKETEEEIFFLEGVAPTLAQPVTWVAPGYKDSLRVATGRLIAAWWVLQVVM